MFGNLLTTLMLTCAMGMPSIKPVETQVNEENNVTYDDIIAAAETLIVDSIGLFGKDK